MTGKSMPGAQAAKYPSVSFFKAADLKKRKFVYRSRTYLRLISNDGAFYEDIGTTACLTPARKSTANYTLLKKN